MCRYKKIAVFGGSFNPVHNAHILLAKKAASELSLDKVFAVPTFLTPLKDNKFMVSPQDRLNMCRLAWRDDALVSVSDVEILRGGKSYTVDTLAFFARQFSSSELFLIVGADMFMTIHQWHDPEKIFSSAKIVTVPRNKNHYRSLLIQADKLSALGAQSVILKEPVADISSTFIRGRLRTGADVSSYLPENVIEYIKINNLYTE